MTDSNDHVDDEAVTPAGTAATSSLLPQLPPTAEISFEEAHRPSLPTGDYAITLEQKLGDLDYVAHARADFHVAGPRFSLPTADIHSVYPPDGSQGRFDSTLPHVILKRSTLPWERTALREERGALPPWLALVVIDAATELVTTMPVSEVRTAASGADQFPGLPHESTDDPDAHVRIVTVPIDRLPAGTDLDLTAHVRRVTVDETTEMAVVVATRIPEPGRRHAVHLVSIEGLYEPGTDPDRRLWDGHDPAGTIRLISLYSWSFTCQVHDRHSFEELARVLTTGMLRADAELGEDPVPPQYSGFVELDHQLRSGRAVRSWYHGPLLPGAPPGPDLDLPVRTADELLLFDHTTGMLDVSYAAAWELGRTLALQNEPLAVNLHEWKRQEAQGGRRASEQAAMSHLPHLHPSPTRTVEFTGGAWFTRQLGRLAGVPFRYLVADGSALPEESFRFFSVDRRWVESLMDGAFSIGRTSTRELDLDAERYERVPPPIATPPWGMTGFLLRSELVSGYPGLLVEAFSSAPLVDESGHVDLSAAADRVDHVRLDHLAPNVLLGLYGSWVDTVAIHLHPQVLHFGFPEGELSPGPFSLRQRATPGQHAGQLAASLIARAPLALFSRGAQPFTENA